MLDVIFVFGGIWCLWVGVRYLQSQEFTERWIRTYRKSEDGSYPENLRIGNGLLMIAVGIIILIGGLTGLEIL